MGVTFAELLALEDIQTTLRFTRPGGRGQFSAEDTVEGTRRFAGGKAV
jgi:hypothetical protein